MSLRRTISCAFAVAIAMLFSVAGTAGASVYPQNSFTYDGFGGHYEGTCTTQVDGSSFRNSCTGRLVSGTPVSQLTNLSSGSLRGYLTPGGVVIQIIL
ncbi:hypothetical protein KW794_03070 [Candidatus Saccharibacteria bacterium]|nr:hypothetical protein [Candidatus Saccharibacteria bacterium]